MPTTLDHGLFLLLGAIFPLWTVVYGTRRLKRASPENLPRARVTLYRRAIVIQWTLVAAVSLVWVRTGRSWASLGLVPRLTPGLAGVLVGLAIVVVFVWRQRAEALGDEEVMTRLRDRLGRLELMLPHSRAELHWFYALSVTAGLCEELLYRGYLVWYLSFGFALLPATAIAAVLFGLGHAYQGPRGVLTTAMVGLFLGAMFLLTGSLFAGMITHALMDLHSGHLGFAALTRSRAVDEAMDDFDPPGTSSSPDDLAPVAESTAPLAPSEQIAAESSESTRPSAGGSGSDSSIR